MKRFVQPNALYIPVTLRLGTTLPVVLTDEQRADAARRELTDDQYIRAFKLEHQGGQTIELRVRPWPVGFVDAITAACPPDVLIGANVEAQRAKIEKEHTENVLQWIYLGHALRDELDAKLPTTSSKPALLAYAAAVKAEILEAGLLEGHIRRLGAAITQVNQGMGHLGNE